MVQCLGTFAAALSGDLGLIPGIYTVVHNDLLTPGDLPLSWAPQAPRHICGAQTYM